MRAILLATSIIESGLDVPRTNTMIVMRPDLFGLAQLHQLRGHVGRRHRQAFCYLVTEPGETLSDATRTRLGTLETLGRLGAGMAISARDLDLRGGGDLIGERQAGHVRLIGIGLYQKLLAQSLRAARGEDAADRPLEFRVETDASVPADYVPEAEVRINLYHRLARATEAGEVGRLGEEIADRFGPPPEPVRDLLAIAAIRALARSLGVTRVATGPEAVALSFALGMSVEHDLSDALARLGDRVEWNGERLLRRRSSRCHCPPLRIILGLLEELA